jgi:hypothetical protein
VKILFFVIAAVVLFGFAFGYYIIVGGSNKLDDRSIASLSHSVTVARIACIVKPQQQIAFATLCDETVENYIFISVAHAFKDADVRSLQLIFESGDRAPIDSITFPRNADDFAFVRVSKVKITQSALGALPKVSMVDASDVGVKVFVYNEQIYGETETFVIQAIDYSSSVRIFVLNGSIDVGRSGSPVIRRSDGSLLGIVQGNNKGRPDGFNGIQCISSFNLRQNSK